jgi:hypothetical protein
LRRAGRVWRTRGRGGGGDLGSVALNVADASVKLFARRGIWTVGLGGAVMGRGKRSTSDVLRSGIGAVVVSEDTNIELMTDL